MGADPKPEKSEPPKTRKVSSDLIPFHLKFINEELENTINRHLRYEHLDIYRDYLARISGQDNVDGLKDEIEKTEQSVAKKMAELQEQHERLKSRESVAVSEKSTKGSMSTSGISVIDVPWVRRRQTAVVGFYNFFTGSMIVNTVTFVPIFFFPFLWIPFILYCIWIYYDMTMKKPHPSARRLNDWYRDNIVFQYYADYFPMRLIKRQEQKYDPSKNYLFGYHPHGVQAGGALCNFGTNGTHFKDMFPGIHSTVQTLGVNFWVPLWRESCIALGAGDASKKMITDRLKGPPGTSTCIVIGGAKEAIYASPHKYTLVLKTRKGFVKLALSTGASLVPVFSFGENDLYENLAEDHPAWRKWQLKVQKAMGPAPMLVKGRGFFNYYFGLLPHRLPVTTIVGAPVHCPKLEVLTEADVDKYHGLYLENLSKIFYDYRDIFDHDAPDLQII